MSLCVSRKAKESTNSLFLDNRMSELFCTRILARMRLLKLLKNLNNFILIFMC